METTVEGVVKEASLKERFRTFQGELSGISTRQREYAEQQREVYLNYHRLITERQELLALNDKEAAGKFDKEIQSLKKKLDEYQFKIDELDLEKIKEIISKHPDTKLHQLALSIQEEGVKQMETLQTEINQTNNEISEAKTLYLRAVEKAGKQYRELSDVAVMLKRIEEVLPTKRAKHLPSIPDWSAFEISEKELFSAFGRKPFTG